MSGKVSFLILIVSGFAQCSFELLSQQANHPPVVKIETPQNNYAAGRDGAITYKISVSDQEDGSSEYDEINSKEVLLEVRYLKNGKVVPATMPDNAGLNVIMISNCITCHGFNNKAMGPSFLEINKRYAAVKGNVDTLAKRIRNGSSGIWGKEKMPAHPELSDAEIRSITQWLIKRAGDSQLNYYVGTEGYFRLQPAQPAGSYQLTASYTDHGLKDVPGKKIRSQDVIMIRLK